MKTDYITPFCVVMSLVNDMPVCATSSPWSGNVENLSDDNGNSDDWFEL
jgi:hypothetical protein